MIADGATRRRLAYYSCDSDAKASRARANCASDSACAPAGAVATATPSIIAAPRPPSDRQSAATAATLRRPPQADGNGNRRLRRGS
ncbi:hypothetical protein G6F68_014026 [Rhizopus microsporus]|nr:hypothetical protein G6F68_014026 [Rhizopus microsporus]